MTRRRGRRGAGGGPPRRRDRRRGGGPRGCSCRGLRGRGLPAPGGPGAASWWRWSWKAMPAIRYNGFGFFTRCESGTWAVTYSPIVTTQRGAPSGRGRPTVRCRSSWGPSQSSFIALDPGRARRDRHGADRGGEAPSPPVERRRVLPGSAGRHPERGLRAVGGPHAGPVPGPPHRPARGPTIMPNVPVLRLLPGGSPPATARGCSSPASCSPS